MIGTIAGLGGDDLAEDSLKMPALFVGHGSPMNALEDNEFSREWAEVGASLPTPKAILCVSAHWETASPRVTAMALPRTIHDFRGFPDALFSLRYPAPGAPELAHHLLAMGLDAELRLDHDWGLDHGTWCVLCRMFPRAEIPVLQLSLARNREPEFHFNLGAALRPLRDEGVLIVGSGNIVHNLSTLVWRDAAFDWAVVFDAEIARRIVGGDLDGVVHWDTVGPAARLAVPTAEHFLPLLYVLGVKDPEDAVAFFCDRVTLGSISMRSVWVGRRPRE